MTLTSVDMSSVRLIGHDNISSEKGGKTINSVAGSDPKSNSCRLHRCRGTVMLQSNMLAEHGSALCGLSVCQSCLQISAKLLCRLISAH